MSNTDDEVYAIIEHHRRRYERLRNWVIALAATLAFDAAQHACDNVSHRRALRSCVERAP